MHLVEQYALSCGVKIDQPSVQLKYFPLPFKEYIVLHPTSGMDSKNYDYYEDVIDLLAPYLKIPIIQIGAPKDKPLKNCYHLQGVTTVGQSLYIIQNCQLLIGNDSFSSHVAGGFDKKIVGLYSNLFKECCQPYWGDKEKQILIQADREGKKPSFSASEKNKVINNVKPEEIASAVLRLLAIDNSLHEIKTLHLGSQYSNKILEIVPNFSPPSNFPVNNGLNIRADYHNNPEIITQWAFRAKTHLVIEEPIDPKYFHPIKGNLVKISIKITHKTEDQYIEFLKSLGLPMEMFCENREELSDLRLRFIRWLIEDMDPSQKKDLDLHKEICDNTYYQSSKTILSHGKEYSSKASWLQGLEKTRNEKIIDNKEFWKESEFVKIYNLTKNASKQKK